MKNKDESTGLKTLPKRIHNKPVDIKLNQYKLTKTIRFKLEPIEIPEINKDIENINNKEFDILAFVSNLGKFLYNIEENLFYKNKEGKMVIKNKIEIKNSWLRQYAKNEIAGLKLEKKQTIGDIKGLSNKIKKVICEINKIFKNLEGDRIQYDERAERAKKGLLIKRLDAKNSLYFLISFVDNSIDKRN